MAFARLNALLVILLLVPPFTWTSVQAQECYTGVQMPWDSELAPCPGEPASAEAPPTEETCYTGIKMPWHPDLPACSDIPAAPVTSECRMDDATSRNSHLLPCSSGPSPLPLADPDHHPTPPLSPPLEPTDLGEPPLGEYFCTYGLGRPPVLGSGRTFFLLPNGEYRADDGEAGGYVFDPATGKISFQGGYFERIGANGEYVHQDQIDIAGDLVSFCSLQ